MEEERSPILDIVGDGPEASRPEASAIGSSSGDTLSGGSKNGTDAESGAMDPPESARSYDFGASTITAGCIRQLEALGYFAEDSAREPGEEVVSDPAGDEAVAFEEFFFVAELWMPP
jgi:hypothetical protein